MTFVITIYQPNLAVKPGVRNNTCVQFVENAVQKISFLRS
mgnify:CR=1 FL=1|jgi:hypothetical protein